MPDAARDPRAPARVRQIVFAGNRRLAYECLQRLLAAGIRPVALMVASGPSADHAAEMRALLPDVPQLIGSEFRTEAGLSLLRSLRPDWVVGVHFPYIVPPPVLAAPTQGVLNLHPAYLPYNRGWHTPSWAILDGTPYGATLHWMDEGIDTGDIAAQREVEVLPTDTADGLYQRALQAELELFEENLEALATCRLRRHPQEGQGTQHVRADLSALQTVQPDAKVRLGDALRRLRALTTNNPAEAVHWEMDGVTHSLQIRVEASGPAAEAPDDALGAATVTTWAEVVQALLSDAGQCRMEGGLWIRSRGIATARGEARTA